MLRKPISADSHITEPPDCYTGFIEAKYRETAPHIVNREGVGDVFVIDGLDTPVPLGLLAAAGKEPADITTHNVRFDDLWKSGWNPKYRAAMLPQSIRLRWQSRSATKNWPIRPNL